MNYEQKYNEALGKARQLCAYPTSKPFISDLQDLFPELKENEDEKMCKVIYNALKYLETELSWDFLDDVDILDVYAWLEKQYKKDSQAIPPQFTFDDILALQCCMETVKKIQEDKDLYKKLKDLHSRVYDAYQLEKQNDNADKVESIFEVGKWIVANEKKYTFLVKRGAPRYQVENTNGDIYSFYLLPNGEEEYHLWTIEDAKNGDVLRSLSHHLIWIYKDSGQYYACVNMNYTTENINTNGLISIPNDVCPATKNEQTILFEKMKEEGYEWDTDKKELIKL